MEDLNEALNIMHSKLNDNNYSSTKSLSNDTL